MCRAFQNWRRRVGHVNETKTGGTEEGERGNERERTYGIKHWGRARSIPRIRALDEHYSLLAKKPQLWVPQDT
eukprot:4125580-Pleurochrysis_carterae.AAC.1